MATNDRSSPPSQAGYSQYPAPKQYPTAHSSSSAFSASANPDEDWTKISDLAERRRIQNRIAQRNYRKKLKKRLEDLERRAGSGSASPEQSPEELPLPLPSRPQKRPSRSPPPQHRLPASGRAAQPMPALSRHRSDLNQVRRDRTPDTLTQQYALPSEDRAMFSQQYTRQLSTSPPPFSYASMPVSEDTTCRSYSCASSYCHSTPSGLGIPFYQHYLPPMPTQNVGPAGLSTNPVKQEYYADDDISPFSMSYANLASAEMAAPHAYYEVPAYH